MKRRPCVSGLIVRPERYSFSLIELERWAIQLTLKLL